MSVSAGNCDRPNSLVSFAWSFVVIRCANAVAFGLWEGPETSVRSFLSMAVIGVGVYGTFKGINYLRMGLLTFFYMFTEFTNETSIVVAAKKLVLRQNG